MALHRVGDRDYTDAQLVDAVRKAEKFGRLVTALREIASAYPTMSDLADGPAALRYVGTLRRKAIEALGAAGVVA